MSVYDLITERVVDSLKRGVVPWRKPWRGDAAAPRNLVSKRFYRGVNAFVLGALAFDSPFWLTFKQARQLGGYVCRGEKACPVVFWKWIERKDAKTDEVDEFPVLRYFSVFNLQQCELPGDAVPTPPELCAQPFQPIECCEQVVRDMPCPPRIEHDGHGQAYYRPLDDTVHLPTRDQFDLREEYYSTLFHELTHATGHEKRLNRKGMLDRVHSSLEGYCKEELIAEMGAAFLCGHCSIDTATLDNSAGYIAGWLGALANDHRLVIQAAASAQKAADFILAQQAETRQHAEKVGATATAA